MLEKLIIFVMTTAVAVSNFVPNPTELRSRFEAGQKLFVLGDYERAIQAYTQVLALESPLLDEEAVRIVLADEFDLSVPTAATYQIANSYKNLGRYDEAVEYFRKAKQRADLPRLSELAQYQIILARYEQEAYEKVIEEAERLVEEFPASEFVERAYYNMGWAYFELERYPESIEAFEAQVSRFPRGEYAARAHFQIGQAYRAQEMYPEAIRRFRLLVDKFAPKEITQRDWGAVELNRLRLKNQVGTTIGKGRDEQSVLELCAKASILIGDSYADMDSLDQAIAAYRDVTIRYTPLTSIVETAFLKIAEITLDRDGLEAAIDVYTAARDESRDRVFQGKMQYQIAKLYFENEEYEKAIEAYEIYMKGFDDVAGAVGFDLADAQYQIASAYFHMRDFVNAAAQYYVVVDSFPESSLITVSLYGAGVSNQLLGRFDEAITALDRIVQEFPDDDQAPLAMLQIGRIYRERQQYDQAISIYESLLEKYRQAEKLDTNAVFYEAGLVYRDRRAPGDEEKAIRLFERVGSSSDFFVIARSEISEIYLRQRRFDDAENVLRSILEVIEDPAARAEVHYYLARLYVSAQRFNQAVPEFTIAIEQAQRPNIVHTALFGRGSIYLQNKDYAAAAADFERLMAEKNVQPELLSKARRRLATAYTQLGRLEEALELARQVLATAESPEVEAEGYLTLAQIYYESANYDEAIEAARQVVELGSGSEIAVEGFFTLGNSYLAKGDYAGAIDTYRQALERYPDTPSASNFIYQIALANYNAGNYEEAAAAFLRLIQEYPEHELLPFALYYRAYALYNLGDWQTAAATFGELSRRFPDRDIAAEAQFQLAEAYFNQRRFEEAYEAYHGLVERYPNSDLVDDALYNSAWALVNLKRIDDAIPVFEEIIRRFPDSPYAVDAQFTIGDWHYNNKRYDEAAAAYQKLIDRYPEHELAAKAKELIHDLSQIQSYQAYEAAMAYFDAGDYERAIEELEKVIEAYPDADVAVGARVNIAAAYEQLGQWKKALDLFEEIIELYKDSPEHGDALAFATEHRDWIRGNR